MALRCK